jgi:hypothetical protein
MARYKIDGITDDRTNCDCCGRTNLKRTVRLLKLDVDGIAEEAVYYGTSCAATALRRTNAAVTKVAREQQAKHDRRAARQRQYTDVIEYINNLFSSLANQSELLPVEYAVIDQLKQDARNDNELALRFNATMDIIQRKINGEIGISATYGSTVQLEASKYRIFPALHCTINWYRASV